MWKNLRHFVTLYNPNIFTNEEEEEGTESEEKDN